VPVPAVPWIALLALLALLATTRAASARQDAATEVQPAPANHAAPAQGASPTHAPHAGKRAATTASGTRAQLQSVRAQIERMRREASREARERDQLTAQLRATELAREKTSDALEQINTQISDYEVRRASTAAARTQQDRALAGTRGQLAAAARAAYMLERSSLPASSPALDAWPDDRRQLDDARLLTYYGYFGRASAERIKALSAQIRQLGGLQDKLAQEQAQLATLKQTQEQTLQQLASEHDQRQHVLSQLTAADHTRKERIARLESEQSDLERVLRSLSHAAISRVPHAPAAQDFDTAFGRARGQLPWPVNGQVTATFGEQRASGLTWDGMVIATQRDTPVHAVSAGRVVYADWLPGLGLLVILDHGDGYLSLYGHNDRLLKPVGASVNAGDVIADAGDTGGRAEPALYFEIRRAGKPIDPRPWFKTPSPLP
jgi:murein hydrolase activator